MSLKPTKYSEKKIFDLPLAPIFACPEFSFGTQQERGAIISLILMWWIADCPALDDEDIIRRSSGYSKTQWVVKGAMVMRAWVYISKKLIKMYERRAITLKLHRVKAETCLLERNKAQTAKKVERLRKLAEAGKEDTLGTRALLTPSFTSVKDEKVYREGFYDKNAIRKVKQKGDTGARVFFTD